MQYVVTLVAAREAAPLDLSTIGRVRDAVAGAAPDWLADGEAADIACAALPDLAILRAALEDRPIDAFALPAENRRRAVLVADMDSTIVVGETLDELADFAGLKDRIAAITARAMNGELDFKSALRERVAMLKGLGLSALDGTWERTRLMPGARTLVATMRAHGARTALVSGGFTYFTSRVAQACGFDSHRSNILLDDGQRLTGQVAEPILDRDAKLHALTEEAQAAGVGLDATLAIGDGANDLPMICAAGLGIAYHAKPMVAATAQHRVNHADLRAALFAQGYRTSQFKL
jgi:phosphoserine phosphatase